MQTTRILHNIDKLFPQCFDIDSVVKIFIDKIMDSNC